VPLCGGDPADTRNFDAEFTKLNVKDASSHNGQEPDSLLSYEGFSFLDEEYRALRSHEQGSSSDLRLSTGSRQDSRHDSATLSGSYELRTSNSLMCEGTDMLIGSVDNDGDGPIDF
jgi:hypothetical protein